MRTLKSVFAICLIFQLFGFTYIAYPSAGKAYTFYGDFHGGPPDARYADALLTPWSAAPPLGLFFAEGKVIRAAINAIHPPQSEAEQHENATQAVITVGVLSRTAALILLFLMARAMRIPPHATAASLAVFSFQYTNIALTQSMKFVAGLPFFILWLWSLYECDTRPTKKWRIIHGIALCATLFSQQWIIFFVGAAYLIYPAAKRATGLPINAFNLAGTAGVAVGTAMLYCAEAWRMVNGRTPLLPIMPSFARSLYLYEYPILLAFFTIACALGIWTYTKASISHEKKFLTLIILPLIFFSRSLTFIHPAILTDTNFMTFFFPYWALISLALYMIIRNGLAENQPAITTLAITAWLVSTLPQLLLVIGVSIPVSPVLDAVVTPILILAAGARPSKLLPVLTAIVCIVAILSSYKFLNYTNGWNALWL